MHKYKERLNAHGGKQVNSINYWETFPQSWNGALYAFVDPDPDAWMEIKAARLLTWIPSGWFVRKHPLRLTKGFKLNDGRNWHNHTQKLLENIYGPNQAGRVRNQHLHQVLIGLGYKHSKLDPCMYYRNGTIMVFTQMTKHGQQGLKTDRNCKIEGSSSWFTNQTITRSWVHMTEGSHVRWDTCS